MALYKASYSEIIDRFIIIAIVLPAVIYASLIASALPAEESHSSRAVLYFC